MGRSLEAQGLELHQGSTVGGAADIERIPCLKQDNYLRLGVQPGPVHRQE